VGRPVRRGSIAAHRPRTPAPPAGRTGVTRTGHFAEPREKVRQKAGAREVCGKGRCYSPRASLRAPGQPAGRSCPSPRVSTSVERGCG
jgi:hypothetical protein